MFPYRTYSGLTSYKRPDGSEHGREWFSGTVHDRGRVLRAYCEMDDDRLIRDSTWTLDADLMPVDGVVRVIEDSVITGSSSFKVSGSRVECESTTVAFGKMSQVYLSESPVQFLGLHPVTADALIGLARGVDRIGEEVAINSITCSLSPNGETGMFAHPLSIGVRYLGEEEVTVPAGVFQTRHYAINWQSRWAPADYWVFGDDCIFVKEYWTQFNRGNELVEFTASPAVGSRLI